VSVYEGHGVTLHHADCLDVLRSLPDCSVDSVVTDPPYGLEFMGKDWDGADGFRRSLNPNDAGRDNAFGRTSRTSPEYRTTSKAKAGMSGTGYTDGAERLERPSHMGGLNPKCRNCDKWQRGGNPCRCDAPDFPNERLPRLHTFQRWCEAWATECLRVLKPGGHLLAFGGTRTWHRLACAVEDAGFEVRDSIAWMYGSGFSKGGLLGNKAGLEWCECGPNALPYSHAHSADLPRVRQDIHPSAVARSEGQDAVLLTPVQRGSERPGVGQARPQGTGSLVVRGGSVGSGEDAWGAEPGMGGRHVSGARQGLPDGAEAGAPTGQSERLRGGAPVGHGGDDRAPGRAAGGSAPHQPGPGGQPTGELEALPGPHEPLDDGARRGRVGCPRCGGLDPAFRGFSTTLKPAFEPVVVARKPPAGTVAANVLAWGTGALNVDGCRIEGGERPLIISKSEDSTGILGNGLNGSSHGGSTTAGRWPANVVLDESQAAALDEQSGESTSQGGSRTASRGATQGASNGGMQGGYNLGAGGDYQPYGDTGGASRFFYVAKADATERPRVNGTAHPTVKPLSLMRWLVRLVTPPGGTVLEPFAGSGTTVEACIIEGFQCIAIEREADYLPLIRQRIDRRRDPVEALRGQAADLGLFDLLGGEGA
jgi:DNA modification methylase